jgi:hypothetical protein
VETSAVRNWRRGSTELGAQGWEAFAYVGYNKLDSIVLKRQKD